MQNKQFVVRLCLPLILIFAIGLTSFGLKHPYYVGVTEIRVDSKQKNINVSCKLFVDDLQTALHTIYHKQVDLSKKDPVTSGLIQDYIKKRLIITFGKKVTSLNYVGYEIEEEAAWIFFEAKLPSKDKKVFVVNTLLYDQLEAQTNFIHCYYDEVRKSYKLVNPDNNTQFEF